MAACDYVTLQPGPSGEGLTLPVEALRLLWDLESRGFQVTRDGADLIIRPFSHLTAADRAALTRWKPHILAVLAYVPRVIA